MTEEAGCQPRKRNGETYSYEEAPNVCVEGVSHTHGTHGLVHKKMDAIVGGLVQTKQLEADGKMTSNEAITAAAKSHTAAFPLSGCSEECIEVQLRDFYEEACPNGKFATVNKNGKPHKSRKSKK